jgi:hypothetical protein
MEAAESIHSVCYMAWSRLCPVADVLDGIGPHSSPQSYTETARSCKNSRETCSTAIRRLVCLIWYYVDTGSNGMVRCYTAGRRRIPSWTNR